MLIKHSINTKLKKNINIFCMVFFSLKTTAINHYKFNLMILFKNNLNYKILRIPIHTLSKSLTYKIWNISFTFKF